MKRTQMWRSFTALACLMSALCIAVLIVPALTKAQQRQVQIARVAADIQAGTVITKDMYCLVAVGAFNLPEGVLTEPSQVEGKYSLADLKAGDFFLSSKISVTCPETSSYLNTLDAEQSVISLSVNSLATGVSGKLKAGDVISVIRIDPQGMARIPDELRYLEVIAATSSKGIDQNEKQETQQQQAKDGSASSIASISLIVDERQARRIAEIEADGKSHLLLVCRGDPERKDQLLKEQMVWLSQNPELTDDLLMTTDDDVIPTGTSTCKTPGDSIASP